MTGGHKDDEKGDQTARKREEGKTRNESSKNAEVKANSTTRSNEKSVLVSLHDENYHYSVGCSQGLVRRELPADYIYDFPICRVKVMPRLTSWQISTLFDLVQQSSIHRIYLVGAGFHIHLSIASPASKASPAVWPAIFQ
ncbi:hypothetical protein CUMW_283640 [Citrus unshiu]|uniref:Uncharacterized protein n=1 Tax=Citrus unshiu TaxID=55188 RepID=A0A2H5MUZ8_CITUN|nr:hypothetical protein CUMW_283640 [Citrus unshiu]